jgi:hypothetical protein
MEVPSKCGFDESSRGQTLRGPDKYTCDRSTSRPLGKTYTMSAMPIIFIYGRDVPLAKSRAMVLQYHGFDVRNLLSLAELAKQQEFPGPALVVFCHSLTEEECRDAVAITDARWPSARRLCLFTGPVSGAQNALCEMLDAGEGPTRLVGTVSMLLPGIPARPANRTRAPASGPDVLRIQ